MCGVAETLTDRKLFDRAYAFAAKHLARKLHTAFVISHEKLSMDATRAPIVTGIAGGADDIKRIVELLKERGIRPKGE